MGQVVEHRLEQFLGLRQLSLPRHAAGQVAAGGLHDLPAVPAQGVQVVLGHRVFVHLCIHGGDRDLGTVAGQHRGGQHVIGHTVGQLGNDIGRGRGDEHQVRLVRHRHVLHLELEVPVKGVHQSLVAGEGLKGHRRDKLRGIPGHEHLDVAAQLHQGRGQVGHFIGRDAARDPQYHCFSLQHVHVPPFLFDCNPV